MDIYWLWLTALKGVGPVTQRTLVKEFGSPQAVYAATQEELNLTRGLRAQVILAGTAPGGHRSGQGHGTFVILENSTIRKCYYRTRKETVLITKDILLKGLSNIVTISFREGSWNLRGTTKNDGSQCVLPSQISTFKKTLHL